MMKYKYKKNNWALLFALFFSFVLIPQLHTQTNSKNSKKDLENKKKRISDEISEINSMLNETKASKKSSIGALININMKLEKRQDLINTINAEIRGISKEIEQNENQVEQLKSSLEKLKNDYARMIIFAQRNQDAYSKIMFVFASENFNQAYARLKYMQQYSEFRKKQATEIISTQTKLIAKLNELKEQRHEKNLLLGNEEEQKINLSSEKQEQEVLLTELQKKEKELKVELNKKKQDAIELQVAIRKLIEAEIKRKLEEAAKAEAAKLAAKKAKEEKEAKENKTKTPKEKIVVADVKPEKKENLFMPALTEETEALSAGFSNNRGKLPWPVGKGVICETYGEHEHPAIKGFMMFNNGVEICATKGTQARAVFEGEVTGIAVSPTGGKLVIVRHGEYLSVYSNLTDVLVKTGQKVSLKQVIGTIVHDDEEGKTSMNLQIWKGQKTMDPSGWLFNAH
ncbi:murein hydrolase activator EnvC [Sediminibacterium sp.]|uniref:murein hydrolase activator EnvC family protein n=1 Tax=Sediminibacterium sp. TaxID=1917865 RepID=UPI002734D304|nr:peptidoglycan DD-metalloendopeptidase family protein [Sediminibacterium sp.]MDP3567561.1 peptidoglycan DD-metalloendopeptidase family protein [Sediminibacterium sp.]